jgi:hypothetical protein
MMVTNFGDGRVMLGHGEGVLEARKWSFEVKVKR